MNYQNILIVKLSAIGDVIHALPVAYALKHSFPQARITWIVERTALELVAGHPFIDDVILFDKKRCNTFTGLISYLPALRQQLKVKHFDLALDLQGLFKSGIISLLSGASKRLVYCNARELSDRIGKKICGLNQKGHIVEQYLDVARALSSNIGLVDFGIQFTETESEDAKGILSGSGWRNEPYLVLIPGANWPNKQWPTSHFAALADRLSQDGIPVVLTGGPGDLDLANEIIALAKTKIFNIAGMTSLKQLAWIIKNARVAVGGDTGPMHLSAAVATPTVAIMGPTDPVRNGPYGQIHRILVTPRECAGCWRRQCEKQLNCLEAVSVDDVYQEVKDLYS